MLIKTDSVSDKMCRTKNRDGILISVSHDTPNRGLLQKFKPRYAAKSGRVLDALTRVFEGGGNVFAELFSTVEHCSPGRITGRLFDLVGR